MLRSSAVGQVEDPGWKRAVQTQNTTLSFNAPILVDHDVPSRSINCRFTRGIANSLDVSVSTVRRRLRDNGIDLDQTYSEISDVDLDQLIRNIRLHFPRLGCQQMRAMLESDHG